LLLNVSQNISRSSSYLSIPLGAFRILITFAAKKRIMSYTQSTMLPLGTVAPDFLLVEPLTDLDLTFGDCAGAGITVVMFICNHCPYVVYVLPQLIELVRDYNETGVQFVAINSNDVNAYPEDAPDKMKELAFEYGFTFPYLYDATQATALAYDAACTPDFYVFDADRKLRYRGQLDSSRPKRNPIESDGADLRAAIDAILGGEAVPEPQKPSGGCNIKWRNDN
jgi:thiol-disulfide isomerase/thioredoxin